MRCVLRRACFVLPALMLCCAPLVVRGQSAADQKTLDDLKTASKLMQLESEGAVPFRMQASFETNDYLGRPDSKGHWTEDFGKPGYVQRVVQDGEAAENYAPEDQAKIGAPAAAPTSNYMRQKLIQAFLTPGPSEELLAGSKLTFKTAKMGPLTLRCVNLKSKEKGKDAFEEWTASRSYCLAEDKPLIRVAQLEFGIDVTYNSIARFGERTFAQQIGLSQMGRSRGKLEVGKLVAAPDLLVANLPPRQEPGTGSGATKVDPMALKPIRNVAPSYPLDSKQRHISGVVVLHAILSKEGTVESMDVISAPAEDMAESAMEAVRQWLFQPAHLLDGTPVMADTMLEVQYSFGR